MLGAVIPVHEYSSTDYCGKDIDPPYVPYVYSLAFAVDQINKKTALLPNVSLGYVIVDSCGKDVTGLLHALEFLPKNKSCSNQTGIGDAYPDVIGVVGGRFSSVTQQMALLLGPFQIPQISYFSTSDELSDKNKFPYHLRTILPNRVQVEAIVEFAQHLNWTYISLLYVDDDYGKSGAAGIRREADSKAMCIAVDRSIPKGALDENLYDAIVDDLMREPHARARLIVIFAFKTEASGVMKALQRARAEGMFTLLASDGWADFVDEFRGVEEIGFGTLSLKSYSNTIPEFNNYWRSLTLKDGSQNPWFLEYWEYYIQKCVRPPGENKTATSPSANTGCSANTEFLFANHPDVLENSMINDAVYAFAFALDSLIQERCGMVKHVRDCIAGPALLPYLRKVSFAGSSGQVEFDHTGDIKGKYMISVYQRSDESGENDFVRFGSWDTVTRDWKLSIERIQWRRAAGDQSLPTSECSRPCARRHSVALHELHCCWTCIPCQVNEILATNDTGCQACPPFSWPDDADDYRCVPIPDEYLRWSDGQSIAVSIAVALGLIASLGVAIVFVRKRNEKLIKACSRELSAIMLGGIALSYVMTLSFIAQPSCGICWLRQIGFHLSFTLLYAPLLTRTVRIYRIFEGAKTAVRRPRFTSTIAQIVIVCAIIGLMVCKCSLRNENLHALSWQ
ncbi:PREDICTED: metabotropic glutamate receptor 3-like [Priapulus caudatus]|uniref:Metabotropic glutamate receptor 3-like n=1 Tax=Priapulus caudatus TaxID=37621 RepID=A0ABM1F8C9_PRICU|nr:PREDICTED: metabotropic glutamate receptor 3-like [Priapulus caudatus]